MGYFGRVRWAGTGDLPQLEELYQEAGDDDGNDLTWEAGLFDEGGALLLEDADGQVISAVRWSHDGEGWRVGRVCTRAAAQELDCDRWLLTKLEAGAIRHNVPRLLIALPDGEHRDYYRRLGYTVEENVDGTFTARKRVGGVWQLRQAEPS